MFNWIKQMSKKKKPESSSFESTFAKLKDLADRDTQGAKRSYALLQSLDKTTDAKELIEEIRKIRFASNVNSVFYFYMPIIAHILYYQPAYAQDILRYLVGPIFAGGDGETTTEELIQTIQESVEYKSAQKPDFITKEGQLWATNELPNLSLEIEKELEICRAELEA